VLKFPGKAAEIEPGAFVDLERFLEAFDGFSAHVYVKDLQSRYAYANRSTLELFGCSAEELAGKGDESFFPPETVRELREVDLRVFSGVRSEQEIVVAGDGPAVSRRVYWEVKTPIYADPGHRAVAGLLGISTDITDHKKAGEELRVSEARFRSCLELTDQIGWRTPPDGSVDDVPHWREYTGQGAKEVVGWGWLEAIHPEDRARTREVWGKAVAAKSRYETEYRIRRKDGVYRHFLVRGIPLLRGDGAIREWVGTCIDITERKEAEEKVAESEERFRSLVIATSQMVWTANAQGEVVNDMPSFRDFTGKSLEEIKGSGWAEALHPEDRARALAVWAKAVESKSMFETEFRMRRHDGEYRHLNSRGVPVLGKDGEIREWIGFCLDITQRKEVEEALRRSREQLQQITDAIPAMIAYIDTEGRYLWANASHEEWIGVRPEVMKGRRVSEVMGDAAWLALQPEIRRVLGGERVSFERELSLAGAPARWVAVNYIPDCGADGRVRAFVVLAQDIGERRLMEREAAKAEAAQAVGAYVRSLIEASLDPFVTIDREGKIADVNEAAIKATGVSREGLIGTEFSSYFTEPWKAREGYQGVFKNGSVSDYPLTLRHKNGKLIDVLYNASVYKDDRGNAVGVFAAARDVSELKRAENELKKANSELEDRVAARTAELQEKIDQLELLNRVMMDREERIIELKKQVKDLKKLLEKNK
jgi:PAS domain S-box-containing protein